MEEDDEPTPEERAEWTRVVEALVRTSPTARRLVDEVVEAFGDVIPTVMLARFGDWFLRSARDPQAAEDVERAVQAIAELYESGDERMETIVATGFLETMPYAHEEDRAVVELLPPPLREELHRMETATPPR